ncbi:dTDP-4-dehydrorhamnose reductase [Methyloligella sp. GL2]|nr:dTDP-4-dehydrorhamnose reductase [Methyloligella sp. GL2]
MKMLVVGREGQLGRSLAEAAKTSSDIEVLALGRPDLDITKAETISAALDRFSPDIVVNAAAYTAVDKAESEAEQAYAVNAEGPRLLAELCAARNIPLVHISTDYVFDGSKDGFYAETDAVAPLGVYGESKLAGERKVAEANPKHIILRTAWVFSPYGGNFVKTMLRLAETRPELGIVDDQRGSPTYAPHLAEAILAMAAPIAEADASSDIWGIYHAGGAGETSWHGLAAEVFRRSAEHGGPAAATKPITTADYPTPAARPANSRLNSGKLAETFGVHLPDWHDGVAECVAALAAAPAR